MDPLMRPARYPTMQMKMTVDEEISFLALARPLRRQADVSEGLPIRGPADQGMLAQYQQ